MVESYSYNGLEKTVSEFAHHLHVVSGLHVGIHDLRMTHKVAAGDGIPNICDYCKKKSALFENRCICNDRDFLNYVSKKQQSTVYSCHLGLSEVIIPVVDNGTTVGVVFLGQALTAESAPSFEELYSKLQDIDPVNFPVENKLEMLKAYDNTKVITEEKFKSLIALTEFIASSIYVNRWLNIRSVTTEQNFRYYMREGIDLIHIPLSSFDVARIADDLNISYSQLNRLSREAFGLPLKQYVLQVKIDTAARLLLDHPDMTVVDVASTVGIENTHYFSRLFSEKKGLSCTEYRKRSDSLI